MSSRPFFLAVFGGALKITPTMKTPIRRLRIATTPLLWAVIFLAQPLLGFAQTVNHVLSLDGDNGHAVVPHSTELNLASGDFSITAWVFLKDYDDWNSAILTKRATGSRNGWMLYIGGLVQGSEAKKAGFSVSESTDPRVASSREISTNEWHHIAVVYNSSTSNALLYVDGNLDATGVLPPPLPTESDLYLGRDSKVSDYYWNGSVDELCVWSQALSGDEILSQMGCRRSGSEPGLNAYWNFDDGTATDLTGRGHDGSLAGGAHIHPMVGADVIHAGCTPNLVLSLNGSGDYLTVTNVADLSFSSGDFSIMAWVFPRDFDSYNSVILAKRAGGSRYGWILTVGGKDREPEARTKAQFQISAGADAYVRSSIDLRTNEWQHIAVVYRAASSVADIYLNGFLNGTATVPPPFPSAPASVLCFGRDSITNQYLWLGNLDEVSIWNEALSSSEIFSKMGCVRSGTEPGLMAYWNFDDGTPADLTGFGHHGTLQGDAAIVPVSGADVIHADCGRALFTGMTLTSEGLPFLTLIGGTGMFYRLDVSTNLIHWSPWVTLPNPYGTLQVIDPDAPNHPRRFYRALKR